MVRGGKLLCMRDYVILLDRSKIHDVRHNKTYEEVIVRYERRFKAADRDNNKLMDRDEFADFLHPRKVISTLGCGV